MREQELQRALLASFLGPIPVIRRRASQIWLVYPALAFIAGTALGLNGVIAIGTTTIFLLACALLLELACQYFYTTHSLFLTFVLVLLFTFALGVERSTQTYVYTHQPSPPPRKVAALVVLTGNATSMKQGLSYPAKLLATLEQDKPRAYNIRGKLLFHNADSIAAHLTYGSKLLATIDFAQDTGRNPNGFDLLAWQRRRGELFVGRAESNSVRILGTDSTITPPLFTALRTRIVTRFAKAGIHDNALELVKAMSIGAREELPTDVRNNFSRSGIAHLLALSGLHVGFVYAIFAFFSHLIASDRLFKRLLRELFPVLATWAFVLLAGASPSLLRAAIMLSVWGVSRIFFLRSHPIDVLSVAAILILWLSPASLYELGFQLSFCALLGILLFYPFLTPYIRTRYKVITWCTQLLTLSLCAQLGTLPIILHAFGTLPLLALFTNLLAIPIAALIVPIALLIGLLPTGNAIAQYGGVFLQLCANLLLGTAERVATLPAVTLTGLRIPTYIAWLLSGCLLFAGVFFSFRARYALVTSLLFLGVFIGAICFESIRIQTTQEWVIYQQSYGTVLSFREGKNIQGVYLQNSVGASRNILQYADGVWGASVQVDSVTTSPVLRQTTYGYAMSTPLRIAIPLGESPQDTIIPPIPTDVLLLTHKCSWRTSELLAYFTPHEVVIDGSYPRWRLATTIQELRKHRIRIHLTRTAGAWVYTKKK